MLKIPNSILFKSQIKSLSSNFLIRNIQAPARSGHDSDFAQPQLWDERGLVLSEQFPGAILSLNGILSLRERTIVRTSFSYVADLLYKNNKRLLCLDVLIWQIEYCITFQLFICRHCLYPTLVHVRNKRYLVDVLQMVIVTLCSWLSSLMSSIAAHRQV